jgi:hypothetical protein
MGIDTIGTIKTIDFSKTTSELQNLRTKPLLSPFIFQRSTLNSQRSPFIRTSEPQNLRTPIPINLKPLTNELPEFYNQSAGSVATSSDAGAA